MSQSGYITLMIIMYIIIFGAYEFSDDSFSVPPDAADPLFMLFSCSDVVIIVDVVVFCALDDESGEVAGLATGKFPAFASSIAFRS